MLLSWTALIQLARNPNCLQQQQDFVQAYGVLQSLKTLVKAQRKHVTAKTLINEYPATETEFKEQHPELADGIVLGIFVSR